MIKDYYTLAKPGLVYGNLIPTIGGFALAVRAMGDGFNVELLIAAVVGIALVMASGCVFNNFIDRDIDARMARTKERALVSKTISPRAAFIYGVCIGAVGFAILGVFTNWLATFIAAVGFFFYVVVYSLWAKRGTVYGAVIGSVAGAVPPVVGYCAASGQLDLAAFILFVILVLWQMPHFYAISIYRFDDYVAAAVPVLPIKQGVHETKITMFLYILAFIFATAALFAFGYEGVGYLVIALILSLGWLALAIKGLRIYHGKTDEAQEKKAPTDADKKWARKMFFLSLIVMVALFGTIIVSAF